MHASFLTALALAAVSVKALQVTSPDKQTEWGSSGSHVRPTRLPPSPFHLAHSASILRYNSLAWLLAVSSSAELQPADIRLLPAFCLFCCCFSRAHPRLPPRPSRRCPCFRPRPRLGTHPPPPAPPSPSACLAPSHPSQTIEWDHVSSDPDSFEILLVNFVRPRPFCHLLRGSPPETTCSSRATRRAVADPSPFPPWQANFPTTSESLKKDVDSSTGSLSVSYPEFVSPGSPVATPLHSRSSS